MEESHLFENGYDRHQTARKEHTRVCNNWNDDTTLVKERYDPSPTSEAGDDFVTSRRGITQRSCADVEITQNLPDLPQGKDRYFFVSYSSEDNDRVWSIVNELEVRFNLPCVFANRDFKPGKNTQDCIKEGMARSYKVLMFFSPKFHESGWCYQEREYAFVCSIESRSNYIIPVKLEDCEIPSALTPLTYVDATDHTSDIPAKIASALIETETFEPENLLAKEFSSSVKKYENGYSFSILGEREKTCLPCKPARYEFVPSSDLFKKLRAHNVKIPKHLLTQIMKFINSSSIMRCYDFSKRKNICCWWLCTIPGLFLSLLFICLVRYYSIFTRTRMSAETYDLITTFIGIMVLLLVILPFVFLLLMCCIPRCCAYTQRHISTQRQIWDKFGEEFIVNGVLLMHSKSVNGCPKLIFMRYNFLKCKDYLKTVIMETYPSIQEPLAETYALKCIKRHVREILPMLADNFDSLPEAPYNRHNVRKGKICLCQHLELEI